MSKVISLQNLDFYDKHSVKPLQETVLTLAQTVLENENKTSNVIVPVNPNPLPTENGSIWFSKFGNLTELNVLYNAERYSVKVEKAELNNPVTWADGSWSDISNMLQLHKNGKINIYDYWNVGDTKKIALNAITAYTDWPGVITTADEQEVEIVLVDKDVMTLSDGSKSTFVWQFKDGLTNKCAIDSGQTSSSWKGAKLNVYLNYKFINEVLPEEFANLIKTAVIKNNSSSASADNTENRKIFLPAVINVTGETKEISGNVAITTGGETTQWEYYKTISNRVKGQGIGGQSSYWWTRTMATSKGLFYRIDTSGVYASREQTSNKNKYLIAPCGCL